MRVSVSGLTQVPNAPGWLYLAIVLDLGTGGAVCRTRRATLGPS
jgi:hypothetical protein